MRSVKYNKVILIAVVSVMIIVLAIFQIVRRDNETPELYSYEELIQITSWTDEELFDGFCEQGMKIGEELTRTYSKEVIIEQFVLMFDTAMQCEGAVNVSYTPWSDLTHEMYRVYPKVLRKVRKEYHD